MYPQVIPYFCVGYIVGVAIGSAFAPLSVRLVYFIALTCASLFFFCRIAVARYVLLFCGALLLGALFSDLAVRHDQNNFAYWKEYSSKIGKFEGRVQTTEEDGLLLKVLVENIHLSEKNQIVLPGILEIKTAAAENIQPNDQIQFIGKIKIPDDYSQGAGHFDPRRYYARYGIYATMVNPRLKVIAPGNTNTLTVMRNYLRSRFQVLLPEPTAGLYSATLLGFMHDVPKALRTDFSNSGLAHLVAISGQHVGMLAVAIFFVTAMAGMPRNLSMLITAISATIFIALVNFPPSGIRSVIMAGAVYWAYASGRKSQGFRILLLTVALMLMMNPRVLLADLGFQLSALAMWGLIVFYPLGQRYFPRVDLFGLKSIFLMTICAMLATVPIIAYSFSRVSLVGLLANVFAAPLYPLLMFFGLLILFLGWLPFAQWLLLTTTNALAQIFLTMVQFSAQLPGANVQLRELSARYVVLYYFLLFILSLIVSRATRKQFWPLVHITKTNNLIVQSEQKKDEK